MMTNLENHFNSDASLNEADLQTLSKYLNDNSAEKICNIKEVIELFQVWQKTRFLIPFQQLLT